MDLGFDLLASTRYHRWFHIHLEFEEIVVAIDMVMVEVDKKVKLYVVFNCSLHTLCLVLLQEPSRLCI